MELKLQKADHEYYETLRFTAAAAGDQQKCHKKQEKARRKNNRNQYSYSQRKGAGPYQTAVSHFYPPCLSFCFIEPLQSSGRAGDQAHGIALAAADVDVPGHSFLGTPKFRFGFFH